MKRNVSVVRLIVATRSNGPPASQPGSVASGTHCMTENRRPVCLIIRWGRGGRLTYKKV